MRQAPSRHYSRLKWRIYWIAGDLTLACRGKSIKGLSRMAWSANDFFWLGISPLHPSSVGLDIDRAVTLTATS